MDRSADASGVRTDIPAAADNNPTMDRQHIDDNHNYPPHRSGITNQAYDVEANVDDDNRFGGYDSDHHFIPIGGSLVLQYPGDDTMESVNGPELSRYNRENDRSDNVKNSRDNLNKSRENLNNSRGRISPFNPSPVGFRPLNPSNKMPDSNSRDLKPPNQPRDSSPRDFNPSNQHYPNQSPTPYNDQSHHAPFPQTPDMSNPSGADTDNRADLNNSVVSESDLKLPNEWVNRLKGAQNEAYEYDGDADTDHSYQGGNDQFHSEPLGDYVGEPRFQDVPLGDEGDEVTMRRNSADMRDPFPVLGMGRPVSGRYLKNPSLERKKSHPAPGPYDPFIGMYVAPPPVVTKTEEVPKSTSGKRRKRIPQPPSKLKLKCACAWSCLACLIGSIFCAIPALRYAITANESAKVHDYNSANSYLRKAIILCAVALVVGAVAWALFIIFYLAAR